MGKQAEIKPRVVIYWQKGLKRAPRLFSVAKTPEEAKRLEHLVQKSVEQMQFEDEPEKQE